ncbi:hypothetical protein [Streptomyces sp. NPDC002845]
MTIQANPCTSWKMAGGIPRKWKKSSPSPCATFGRLGYKVRYEWKADRGTPCIKVLGFNKRQKAKWYDAGCGKSGFIKNVPWGNVAASKQIKIKGASLLKWK